jgi:nucleotide-binding universal stress UspA family protein
MFKPKKILVPVDFSDNSSKAVKEAFDIAEKYNSKVYLLHVIDSDLIQQCAADYCLPVEIWEKYETEAVNNLKEKMKNEVDKYSSSNAVEVNFDIKKGTPYKEIIKEQKDNDIDLIVMAAHGKGGFIKHILGSVTDKVVKSAGPEVLLVRD